MLKAKSDRLAFGGVGDSGQGAYRGKASFDCFTHRRSVTTTPGWIEGMLDVRYPPFTDAKLKKVRKMQDLRPDFDRQGNPTGASRMVWWIMGLGGKSKVSAVARWVMVGVLAVAMRVIRTRGVSA